MRDRVWFVVFLMVVVPFLWLGCGNDENPDDEEVCGNGVTEAAEQCDDGNNADSDGCSAMCTIEPPSPVDIATPGSTFSASGVLDGTEFQWMRPGENCEPETPVKHSYFDVFSVVNNTGADQMLTITATWGTGDGFLHVFRDNFDPSDLSGCMIGNDDFNDSDQSRIVGVEIAAGQVLYVVASSYLDNATLGDYVIDIRTAACGDGVVDPGELCDDGNNADSDGCDAECLIELPPPVDIAALGGAISAMGTIDGTEFLWTRPDEVCAPESDTEYYYFDMFSVVNNTGADQTLTITAVWADGDGYLHVFMDPFNPFESAGCVIGNDDFNDSDQSRIVGVEIAAGQVLHVIASTYSDEDIIGDYVIEIRTSACGNGVLDAGEQCDDGNTTDGDGCDAGCAIEVMM